MRRWGPPPAATVVIDAPLGYETVQKRQYFRVPARLPVRIAVTASQDPACALQQRESVTADVSAGGVCFETTLPLGPGDRLALAITFPRGGRSGHVPDSERDRMVQLLLDLQRTVR